MNEARWLRILFANLALSFTVSLIPQVAAASIVITEIMYDVPGSDSGREWIEIFNDGVEPVSLEGWRFLEGGTKHKLTAVLGGNTVQSKSYAIIADNADNFRTDFSGFSGQLFDSVFSLSNAGETLGLSDGNGANVFSTSYQGSQGAVGDGNSLNLSGGSFIPRAPTPGAALFSAAIAPPPPKKTKSAKPKKENAPVAEAIEAAADGSPKADTEITTETPERVIASEQQTAAVILSKSSIAWWVAAAFIALSAGGALFYARSLKKDEWNIIEQTE